jgi:hypothetical protein
MALNVPPAKYMCIPFMLVLQIQMNVQVLLASMVTVQMTSMGINVPVTKVSLEQRVLQVHIPQYRRVYHKLPL